MRDRDAGGAPSTFAAERTQLARTRTVVALVLTATIVARAALSNRPAAALACLVVGMIAMGLWPRRAPLGAGRALLLTALVVALAATGLVVVG